MTVGFRLSVVIVLTGGPGANGCSRTITLLLYSLLLLTSQSPKDGKRRRSEKGRVKR